ncbi:hypothetical protein [Okeania sp. KiyG1]|nr:hypothetical protein [Okeania sp. KiyG1]
MPEEIPCRFFGASQDDNFSLVVNNSDRIAVATSPLYEYIYGVA